MFGGRNEPHPLDCWFAMQRGAWFKKWKWVVLLICLAFLVRVCYEIFDASVWAWVMDVGIQEARQSHIFQFNHQLWRVLKPYIREEAFLWWPVAIGLASSIVVAQLPRGEMLLPFPAKMIFRRLLFQSRKVFWIVLGICGLAIPLIGYMFFFQLSEFALFDGRFFEFLILVCFILFISELQIALLIRMPFRFSRLWLYILPALICTINLEMMKHSSSDFVFTYFSPSPFTTWQLNAVDIVVATGHLTGVLVGIGLGCYWLLRLLKANDVRRWAIYFFAVLLGQFLPMVSFVSTNIWTSRIVIPVSAYFRGTNLGNPLLGWTEPYFMGFNPYARDTESLIQHITNLVALGRENEIWETYDSVGMVFSPWLYIPTWAAYLWVIVYFGISIGVIIRGNSLVPEGFTGVWESNT